MLGGVYEWCQDRNGPYRTSVKGIFQDLMIDEVVTNDHLEFFAAARLRLRRPRRDPQAVGPRFRPTTASSSDFA